MAQNAERLKSIEKMTIEQYLEKYDKYIRGLIYKRADSDYRDDAYQEVVMQIIKYKDKLDSLDTGAQRCAYICQIAKHTALPSKRANKKLKTYGDFTSSDDDDATDPLYQKDLKHKQDDTKLRILWRRFHKSLENKAR